MHVLILENFLMSFPLLLASLRKLHLKNHGVFIEEIKNTLPLKTKNHVFLLPWREQTLSSETGWPVENDMLSYRLLIKRKMNELPP